MSPDSTKCASLAARMFGAISRLFWNALNRVIPANAAFRRMSRLQRSPAVSRALAAEQTWFSYVRPSMTPSVAETTCIMLSTNASVMQVSRQRMAHRVNKRGARYEQSGLRDVYHGGSDT